MDSVQQEDRNEYTISDITQESIDDIMDCFDFERVQLAMKSLDWRWGSSIPEVYEIRKEARRLLKQVATREHYMCATGGLEAYYHKEDRTCSLKFVLETWGDI
jgi:hypothetical protein